MNHPGKSFGLKFIPNQSDLFRNLFPRQSELIRVNPRKVFNLVWCNSVKNQSVSIWVNPRLWIRMNPDPSFNPHESEVGILRIDSDWFGLSIPFKSLWPRIHLDQELLSDSFGLEVSDWVWLIRIKFWLRLQISDWDGLIFNRITSNEIENFFRIVSNEFGLARKQILEWIGMNLIGSEWISIRNFYQGRNFITFILSKISQIKKIPNL